MNNKNSNTERISTFDKEKYNNFIELFPKEGLGIIGLLKKLKMNDGSIKKLLEENIVMDECPNCETYNLEELAWDQRTNKSIYHCRACKKNYIMEWEKRTGTNPDYVDFEDID